MTEEHNPSRPGSPVEAIKQNSRGLRGSIAESLTDATTTAFAGPDVQLLKFHGIYQQDDRDARIPGHTKVHRMMVRVRVPGGRLTADQWLALDDVADRCDSPGLRITSRQGIQYHGVVKHSLKETIAAIDGALLTTLAACGDVARNVMAPPAPYARGAFREAQAMAEAIARDLTPATGAYHEIWLDGVPLPGVEEEPFYGPAYLPRKFKIGVALDVDNSIDVYTLDCGLVGLTSREGITRYALLAGGGLGMTHRKADTVARLASVIGTVAPDQAVEAVRTVAAIFRDHGNRADRRHARLKYLLEAWGEDRFRTEFQHRVPWTLGRPVAIPPVMQSNDLGWHDQGDGRFFLGVFVAQGRVIDDAEGPAYRSAFREIAATFGTGVRLTPTQNVLFTDVAPDTRTAIEEVLYRHRVPGIADLSPARRWSIACPALPTCGLALAESERMFPAVLDALEAAFPFLRHLEAPLTVRMTGCPNGCARPYNADLALVGRRPGVYHVYVGGGLRGNRLADLWDEDVRVEGLAASLRPLMERYRRESHRGEALGDFYQRVRAAKEPRSLLTGREVPTRSVVAGGEAGS